MGLLHPSQYFLDSSRTMEATASMQLGSHTLCLLLRADVLNSQLYMQFHYNTHYIPVTVDYIVCVNFEGDVNEHEMRTLIC